MDNTIDGRMRRACSPFEAWGAGQLSRFAARSANCLKVAGPAEKKLRVKKTASFGKSLGANGWTKYSRGSGGAFFTKQIMTSNEDAST